MGGVSDRWRANNPSVSRRPRPPGGSAAPPPATDSATWRSSGTNGTPSESTIDEEPPTIKQRKYVDTRKADAQDAAAERPAPLALQDIAREWRLATPCDCADAVKLYPGASGGVDVLAVYHSGMVSSSRVCCCTCRHRSTVDRCLRPFTTLCLCKDAPLGLVFSWVGQQLSRGKELSWCCLLHHALHHNAGQICHLEV